MFNIMTDYERFRGTEIMHVLFMHLQSYKVSPIPCDHTDLDLLSMLTLISSKIKYVYISNIFAFDIFSNCNESHFLV